jgi:hypothetical protein
MHEETECHRVMQQAREKLGLALSDADVVRWTAPANDGGAAVTGYEVQVVNAATGATVGALRPAAADASQLTVTGLANGTAYRFRVRALNEVGAGRTRPRRPP